MSELFENITPGQQVTSPTPPRKRNRLEYYNNGPDAKWPVTQYGLVWDIDNSAKRINLNFGLVTIDQIGDICDNPGLTTEEQQHITAVGEFYCEIGDRDLLVTFGKRNALSGTGQHNLRVGIRDFDYSVAAIMRVNPGRAPDVYLYDRGAWHTLTCNWQGCAHSSHPAKLWQVKF